MDFSDRLNQNMVAAAKAQDKLRLSTLRLMKTAVHNREIDLKRPLNDGEYMQLLSSMVKQRRDSIEQFSRGGRTDLVEKEETEIQIIQEFMPSQMSDDEIGEKIEKAVTEVGATSAKDMGKVMKILMPKLTGKADGKAVGEKVRQRLAI